MIPRGESYRCARRGWRCTQRGRCVAEAQNHGKCSHGKGATVTRVQHAVVNPLVCLDARSSGCPTTRCASGITECAPRSVQRVAAGVTEGRRQPRACEGRVGQSRIDQGKGGERRLTPGSELPWSRHLAVRPSRRRCANRRYRSCRVSGAPFCERNYQLTCPGAPRNLGSCNPHRCGQLGFWRRRR